MFSDSVVNLLRTVIHYSKYSKSVQKVVVHYIFSSESLHVVTTDSKLTTHTVFSMSRSLGPENTGKSTLWTNTGQD